MSTLLLTTSQIEATLRRMAIEIAEINPATSRIVLVGRPPRAWWLAERLRQYLLNSALGEGCRLLDPEADLPTDALLDLCQNQHVVLVDDVLNTGETLFGLSHRYFSARPARLDVAVLVNRGYSRFPIAPTVLGLELGTTMQQYIELRLDPATDTAEVWLS